jgi:hypothetical protein
MILDVQNAAPAKPAAPPIAFVTMQLMPLADGMVGVSLKSTVFDESELELVDEDIVDGRVSSLDQVFDLIRSHVLIKDTPKHLEQAP